ncbi:enoyl-hydratase isomerase family protein [Ceraceosorus bombacis]|uniref:Enoyl-hydratase isomerase family protein n=1 Tax=Ceraceosorus bombacis TaxID=401625 RepID=A0A0P1BJ13_9BASI|nr:enoyl-hydratase isomerase family protein [Ceraceosorus bombacis]
MSVLHNPHPPLQSLSAEAIRSFPYSTYGWRHIRVVLGGDEANKSSQSSAPPSDGVLLVLLNRPDRANAYTTQMCHDLVFVFELADRDPRVKVRADLSGASGGGFGADADIAADHRDGGGQAGLSIAKCRKLVIAAVNGNAVGIGLTMVLSTDIRLVAANAKVGIPFVKRGISMEATSSYLLPRLVGHSNALKISMTGDTYRADDPTWRDLWYNVLPAEQVLPEALKLAGRLAVDNSVISMALNKALIWQCPPTREETHLLESKMIWEASKRDAQEGVLSFMQKRKPKFEGTVEDVEKAETCVPDWSSAFNGYPWWTEADLTGKKTRGLAKL